MRQYPGSGLRAFPGRTALRHVRHSVAFLAVVVVSAAVSFGSEAAAPRLDAFVNWDYRWNLGIPGTVATERLIRETLEIWYPGGAGGRVLENGSADDLRLFLNSLPGQGESRFDLVYLASHQSKEGEWKFTRGEVASWSELLEGVAPPRSSRRIVILDACYAEAIPPEWRSLPALTLFACSAEEETFEVILNRKQPVHFRKHYPGELAWIEEHFGSEWMRRDSRLSFLGFIWLRAFLETERAPEDLEDWKRFLLLCEEEAARFRASDERRRRLGSAVRMESTPGGALIR